MIAASSQQAARVSGVFATECRAVWNPHQEECLWGTPRARLGSFPGVLQHRLPRLASPAGGVGHISFVGSVFFTVK